MTQVQPLFRLALLAALASIGAPVFAETQDVPRIDHILLGVPDLDHTVDELAKVFGVKPVYGGKHPRGTHNALLSLGPHTYLELIALQPGVVGSTIGMSELDRLTRPTLIGWAVSAADLASLRSRLDSAGFLLSPSSSGSRKPPSGAVLRWHTSELATELAGAPFFIAWSPDSPHPAKTSPRGCTLVTFQVTSPDAKRLRALTSALKLKATVVAGPSLSFSLTLRCPNGPGTFQNSPSQQ